MNSQRFEVLSVRAAEAGAKYLARVSFTFMMPSGEVLAVTRRANTKAGWRTFTEAEVYAAADLHVKVESGLLCRSQRGELFVVASGLKVPWEIALAVAEAAFARLNGGQSK